MNTSFQLFENKQIEAMELAELFGSVGWGDTKAYDETCLKKSLQNHSFIAYVRDVNGKLAGYISAFSDESFSTHIDGLVVRPEVQREGIGKELLRAAERRFAGTPFFIDTFEDAKGFFLKLGYTDPKRSMVVVSKRNGI